MPENRVRNGSESSDRKENSRRAARGGGNGKHRRGESGSQGSAEQKLKSSAKGVTQAQMIRTRVGGWNVHEERETRRWTEQSSEGIVEPWEVSAGGDDRSSEGPNKSREVEQLGRAERNGQTELRNIRICGGFKAVTQPTSCSNTPEAFGTKTEPRPRVPRGICREGEGSGNGKQRSCRPKAGGQPNEAPRARWNRRRRRAKGMTEVRKMQTNVGRWNGSETRTEWSDRAPERCSKDAVTTYRIWRAQSDNATCKLQQHPRDVRNRKDRDRGSEGNFAKSCKENRRRAPKIAGGANRGLEGSTERDLRLNGASETQGRKVTKIRESRRKIWPRPGEDVWDFGKDVRDPERPESFSGASLGNRKSQNTIRTSVRDTESKPSANGKDRGRAEATGSTGRFGSKPKGEGEEGVEVEDEPNGNWANPMVRNELQKSEGRGEEPRDFGDKTSEVSETTEMEERKCQGIRDPKSVPENKSG
ncbi:hypothetical protein DFH06DRAFT_1154223 [Mycena polygramma]|nr:hypothetical protein DFH06DRAFT_1154223 [Mycena polygramma]